MGKESREPLKLSPICPLEPGTVAEGPRVQDFFKLCTPAALRRDSLQGAWVHTHTSLLTRGPAVRAPPNQWVWTHSKLPLMSLLPSRILCEKQRCTEQGVFIQGTSDPGTQLFRLRPSLSTPVHTQKAGVPPHPHQRDPWYPLRPAPKKNVLRMSDGETGRGWLLTGLEEVGEMRIWGGGPSIL